MRLEGTSPAPSLTQTVGPTGPPPGRGQLSSKVSPLLKITCSCWMGSGPGTPVRQDGHPELCTCWATWARIAPRAQASGQPRYVLRVTAPSSLEVGHFLHPRNPHSCCGGQSQVHAGAGAGNRATAGKWTRGSAWSAHPHPGGSKEGETKSTRNPGPTHTVPALQTRWAHQAQVDTGRKARQELWDPLGVGGSPTGGPCPGSPRHSAAPLTITPGPP